MAVGLGPWLLALAWAAGPAAAYQGDEIKPATSAVWWREGGSGTLRCTYSSNASYIYVAWYRQRPGGPLQYLLQSKGRGGSYSHTAPFARKRFSCQADKNSGTLIISELEVGDSALYYCTLQEPRLGAGVNAALVFGNGTQLSVEPNDEKSSVPQVIVMKSKKVEDDSIGKAACLARNFYPKNISLEMTSNEVVYEQSTSILTSEGLYDTIKVVNVAKDTGVTCMAKFNSSTITANATLPEKESEEPVTGNVCNTSAQDTKVEKANMLSMAVLGLRVLLAKSIAFNTLMSIKLFLF
ncbi:T cell receptor alpha chain MC.7.G5-like [Falco rusticolus]|uniref:T cell receptor alpha chain MC.7.G5-like n=1 Tax=Falco rusticolus TaxID=120794 RepID=UPI0018868CC8|nr:T cell receptor alpha chain MC.7.G5-like [Falco rusticolus]